MGEATTLRLPPAVLLPSKLSFFFFLIRADFPSPRTLSLLPPFPFELPKLNVLALFGTATFTCTSSGGTSSPSVFVSFKNRLLLSSFSLIRGSFVFGRLSMTAAMVDTVEIVDIVDMIEMAGEWGVGGG